MKQIISKFWILVGLLILGIGANAQTNKKNIYVYMGDSVVFKAKASEVDSVALEEEKTVVSLYNRAGTKLYSAAYADVDSISYFMKTPVADLLDIKFTADGQASDVSDAQQNVIIEDPDGALDVQWSDLYQTYEARFANTWAGNAESYIKIDYSVNDWYKERLADGHTMETLFKAHYTPPIQNAEAKWFSAMEAGGTGFLITTISGERQNEITFLPNVSPQPANNWIWTTSGVVPEPEVYYHVVGVWNKEEGKSYIYVNGELKNVVDAVGNFNFPSDLAAQWIGIGCDASAGGGASSGDWTIVTSRIYSKALNQYEAEALWDAVAPSVETPQADVLDIVFHKDGTAEDVSKMKNKVELVSADNPVTTYYNGNYGNYAAKMDNAWGQGSTLGDKPNAYKVNYADNQAFKDALADGHSLETIFKATYTGTIPNAEAKWFASHQGGGTGFLISTIDNNSGRQNEITFLPNVSTTGGSNWIWATSGVVPEPETYYHVVGVWNKEEGKAYVYVNGELKNTVDAQGELVFPSDGANWFGIGCDANPNGIGEQGGNWEVVRTRIYDNPLTTQNVAALWNDVSPQLKAANDSVADAIAEEQIPVVDAPVADVLDVVFNADGTAEDVSPMHNEVGTHAGDGLVTYYNNTYGKYVARFDNTWAGAATGWYSIDFRNNEEFWNKLADGHTLETVFMGDYEGDAPASAEAKWFACHQGGGTGFLVSTGTQLNFLPHTDGAYRWANTNVTPKSKTYYHLVGVWNKEEGKAYVYLNGDLLGTVDAPGELSKGAGWFAIGGDAQNEVAEQAWIGDVVTARIYDAPLDIAHVRALWRQVEEQQASAAELVTNVSYLNNLSVLVGGNYSIKGEGFQAGDQIVFTALSAELTSATLDAQLTEDGVTVTLPTDFLSGRYLLSIKRGEQVQDVTPITLNVVETMPEGSKVIAHRGYWNTDGAAQNSIASVQNAIDNKFYGAEIDVYITQDDHLVVNHDPTINGINIENSNFDDIKDQVLSNGETISELKDILELFKDPAVTTKLIIEIKQHSTSERGIAAAEAVMNEVAFIETSEEVYMPDRVEYISFGLDICQAIADFDDVAKVAYLNGDKSPQELYDLGIKGLDYTLDRYTSNPTWIQEAKDLGLTTNVWTINDTNDMIKCNNLGIDFITTDNPVEAERIRNLYANPGE